jgi:PIN domain nuclease of toxin-antitoxin system
MQERVPSTLSFVLDSFAVLALIQNDPGAERVAALIKQATNDNNGLLICAVNLCEVLYRLERRWGWRRSSRVLDLIQATPIVIVAVDLDLAVKASQVKSKFQISLGDCFTIALAQRENASVVTGDPEFQKAAGIVDIEWLERAHSAG